LPSNIAIPGPATAVPSGIGGAPSAPFIPVDYYNRFTVQPPSGVRNLSDDELSRLAPEDVLGTVSRSDLTMADRAALTARLSEMQGVSP
jgi:hypothetical protein